MKFKNATNCFQENKRLIAPKDDPVVWNLANGLLNLTLALEEELASLRAEQRKLRQQIAQLQQRPLR